MHQYSRSAYRTADADSTTLAGVLIAVYNNLARDYIVAAEAVRKEEIERRCASCKHGLLLLGHLESGLGEMDEAEAALTASLGQFYRTLRGRTLQLQAKPDAAAFDELARFVLQARAAWQTVQTRTRQVQGSTESWPTALGEEGWSLQA